MITGKALNLRVRPVWSADLAYPVDGLISDLSETLLGTTVGEVDINDLYIRFDRNEADSRGRLLWDSKNIAEYISLKIVGRPRKLLSHLRNASEAAALDQAIMMRQNAYLTSYSQEVLAEVNRVYCHDPDDNSRGVGSGGCYGYLRQAEVNVYQLHGALDKAYRSDKYFSYNYGGVVEFLRSRNDNYALQKNKGDPVEFAGYSDTLSWGYEFRCPSIENDLRYNNMMPAARQKSLNAWRMRMLCENKDITFPNELGAIDCGIRRLQVAYLDTFLISPIAGRVTGVFHGRGDFVRAGEPVLRIENDKVIYLVGTIKYRGMLRVRSQLSIGTTLFEAAGATETTIPGEVLAVRGHDSASEQWDVIIRCDNFHADAPDTPILPLNYNLNLESTTITETTT